MIEILLLVNIYECVSKGDLEKVRFMQDSRFRISVPFDDLIMELT